MLLFDLLLILLYRLQQLLTIGSRQLTTTCLTF